MGSLHALSPLQQAKHFIRSQEKHSALNAFITLADQGSVLRAAKRPDRAFKLTGEQTTHSLGLQEASTHEAYSDGRLIAVKDNICTEDLPTTAASGILKGFTSPYDATVVKLLRAQNAIIAGKTNMDEFGMGSHSVNSHFGAVKQERQGLSAGGSSGGSAVAVATEQCWAALGTDTGGSVRLPAAYNKIFGFKPSYGLLSRWGVIAYANSLDTVGIMARDLEDVKYLFRILNKYDSQDPTSLPPSTRERIVQFIEKRPIRGHSIKHRNLRLGVPQEYNVASLHPEVRQGWLDVLAGLQRQKEGIENVKPVSLPNTRHALSAYYILAPAEASSNLAKYDGVRYGRRAEGDDGAPESVLFSKTREQGFGDEVRRRILLGAFSLSANAIDNYFIRAQKIRRLVQRDFDNVFALPNPLHSTASPGIENPDGVDVLVCPTAPSFAPELLDLANQGPVASYMNDVFTVPASLAGLPALTVPERGIQIIGQYGDDETVLRVAEYIKSVG